MHVSPCYFALKWTTYILILYLNRKGITSVISIQKPGEHADCGYGLEKSGFTYDPQMFMENGSKISLQDWVFPQDLKFQTTFDKIQLFYLIIQIFDDLRPRIRFFIFYI